MLFLLLLPWLLLQTVLGLFFPEVINVLVLFCWGVNPRCFTQKKKKRFIVLLVLNLRLICVAHLAHLIKCFIINMITLVIVRTLRSKSYQSPGSQQSLENLEPLACHPCPSFNQRDWKTQKTQ